MNWIFCYYLLINWSNLLVLRKELRVHEGRAGEEEVLQVVRDLAPVGQLERLDRRVLHVHVRVHPVAHQGLHYGVLGRAEVVVGPELEQDFLSSFYTRGDRPL